MSCVISNQSCGKIIKKGKDVGSIRSRTRLAISFRAVRLLIRCSFSGCPKKGSSKSGRRGDEKADRFRQRGEQILK